MVRVAVTSSVSEDWVSHAHSIVMNHVGVEHTVEVGASVHLSIIQV